MGRGRLDDAGLQAVELTSNRIASLVDEILGKRWSRRQGDFDDEQALPEESTQEPVVATCSCGSGIPIQKVSIDGQDVTLIALPLIFDQFRQAGKPATQQVGQELFDTMKVYNPVPVGAEETYLKAILREYSASLEKEPIQ